MSKIANDLRKLSIEELTAKIVELRTDLVEQKRALAARELPNPHATQATRRRLAVALTLLNAHKTDATTKEGKEA